MSKDIPSTKSLEEGCFYSVIINFLEESERLDPTGNSFKLSKNISKNAKKPT